MFLCSKVTVAEKVTLHLYVLNGKKKKQTPVVTDVFKHVSHKPLLPVPPGGTCAFPAVALASESAVTSWLIALPE